MSDASKTSELIERCARASQAAYALAVKHPLRNDPDRLWSTCGAEVQEANRVTARAVLAEAGWLDRSLTATAPEPGETRDCADGVLDFEVETKSE